MRCITLVMIRLRYFLLAVLVASTAAALAATSAWKEFRTSDFSILYPPNWYTFEVTPDRLDMRSSEGGAEGVVIKRNQAYISVKKEPASSGKTLAAVIDYYNQEGMILSHTDIAVDSGGSAGCRDLEQVVSRAPVVPPEDLPKGTKVPYFIITQFFCEIDGPKFVVLILENYEEDKRQQRYQQVALQMAKSIRAVK